jgi:hypothetical protein
VAGIFLVVLVFVVASAWAGLILFEGAHHSAFATLGESVWKMFICLTTANCALPPHTHASPLPPNTLASPLPSACCLTNTG